MTPRAVALVVLGAATIALFVVLAGKDGEMRDAGGPGIVPYEVAFDRSQAEDIKDDWGRGGRDAARESLVIDYLFLAAYGAFLALAAMATRDLAQAGGWTKLAALGGLAVMAAVAAATFDAIENAFLLVTLETTLGDLTPFMAGLFACLKFASLAFVLAYLLAGLGSRVWALRSGGNPA